MTSMQDGDAAGRRAILRIRWGAMAHRQAILVPGQTVRVGQDGQAATFVVASDVRLGRAHFELTWDGSRGWLNDLGSPEGTLLDGQRVERGEVFNGSWIRASHTDFSIYFERATPNRVTAERDSSELASHKGSILQWLQEQPTSLFAILDASANERILQLLRESVAEYRSLYEGPRGESLEDVAPYLVELSPGSGLREALAQEGWGRNWGVYLKCQSSLEVVRRHLRKLLIVDVAGQPGPYYFRFYDPRVLKPFLETCDDVQRSRFFGPIECFVAESPTGLPCHFISGAVQSHST